MKQDLLLVKEKGTTALTAFIEERLNSTGFFQTLPKLKLGSFCDAQKKMAVAAGDRNVIIRADRNLFARLLVIGHQMPPDGPKRSADARAWSFHGRWLHLMVHWPRQTKPFFPRHSKME